MFDLGVGFRKHLNIEYSLRTRVVDEEMIINIIS